MYSMRIALICIILCCYSAIQAQSGNIVIHDNAGANALVEKYILFNTTHNKLPGWRIQILSTPQLSEAKKEKGKLIQQFLEMHATIIFEAPNYKVRVGDYRIRIDATRDLQELILYYPNAFICKDLVDVKRL